MDETKGITSDNLKFYEGTVEFIKWVMGGMGAGVVVLLGFNSYRIYISKKEIDDRIDNFRDETIEKAKEILDIKVEKEKENISRAVEEKIKNFNSTLDNKIENIYNENNQNLLFIEINTILNIKPNNQEKLKSLYSLLEDNKYKNNQYIIKYNLANIYEMEKEYDKAIENYKIALSLKHDFEKVKVELANCYLKIKDYNSLVKECFSVIEINPEGNEVENLFEKYSKNKKS
ncbi:hypothetical protein [Fusobacterium sp.]|uniref:tetratricopeptide repeat protein n=1 Tax=Fusobacterium sp. TaxID=68766 RepID=UPI002629F1C0|nr:hypothetical protein [Fusobacterium sp.]